VLVTEQRLRDTLAHEMCHVAAWALSREYREHHGRVFKTWAALFKSRVPSVCITVRHSYQLHLPFHWKCTG